MPSLCACAQLVHKKHNAVPKQIVLDLSCHGTSTTQYMRHSLGGAVMLVAMTREQNTRKPCTLPS